MLGRPISYIVANIGIDIGYYPRLLVLEGDQALYLIIA
jgi:hypothetical protein